jgi:hypothetical protein
MLRKCVSSIAATVLVAVIPILLAFGAMAPTAWAETVPAGEQKIPNNCIIFGGKAYDLSLLNDASLMNEILSAFIANGNRFAYKTPAGTLLDPSGNPVDAGTLPVVTYLSAGRAVTRYKAGDSGVLQASVVSVSGGMTTTTTTLTVVLSAPPATPPVSADFAVAKAQDGAAPTAVTPVTVLDWNATTRMVTLSVAAVTPGMVVQRVGYEVSYMGSTPVGMGGWITIPQVRAAQVTLWDADSGTGKIATVTITGYAGVEHYVLYRLGSPLTGMVDTGNTSQVPLISGDMCMVEVWGVGANKLGEHQVVAQPARAPGDPVPESVGAGATGSVTITLGNWMDRTSRVGTIAVSGYGGAGYYRILTAGRAPISPLSNIGVGAVAFANPGLNPGDTCKVEIYDSSGVLIDTRTVVAH